MTEENERLERVARAILDFEGKVEVIKCQLEALYDFFMTGKSSLVFDASMVMRDVHNYDDLWFLKHLDGVRERVSFLEMSVGKSLPEGAHLQNSGKVFKPRRDYSKCICSMEGMPADFNASPDCPIHGDPKVLEQLAFDPDLRSCANSDCGHSKEDHHPSPINGDLVCAFNVECMCVRFSDGLSPMQRALERVELAAQKLLGINQPESFGMRLGYEAAAVIIKQEMNR